VIGAAAASKGASTVTPVRQPPNEEFQLNYAAVDYSALVGQVRRRVEEAITKGGRTRKEIDRLPP
jgi:hypothetical protein